MPGSLAALTESRIGRIHGEASKALLAMASLANPTIETVATAAEVAPHHLLKLLEEAEVTGVVAVEGNRVRFAHPLLARAVQSAASPARRRGMHRRLADVVIEPELRARHLALSDPVGGPDTLAALDGAADIAHAAVLQWPPSNCSNSRSTSAVRPRPLSAEFDWRPTSSMPVIREVHAKSSKT